MPLIQDSSRSAEWFARPNALGLVEPLALPPLVIVEQDRA
jgi:hypothetical protein